MVHPATLMGYRKRFGFKPSMREQRTAVARQLAFMASAAPDEKREAAEAHAAAALASIPAKRKYTKRDVAETEAPVLDAVGDVLWKHPLVLLAIRQNSGMAGYVQFFKIIRQPEGVELKLPDYWGFLTDSRPFAVECKKPQWKGVSTEREESQAAFLGLIRSAGGIALFATSAEEVAAALR